MFECLTLNELIEYSIILVVTIFMIKGLSFVKRKLMESTEPEYTDSYLDEDNDYLPFAEQYNYDIIKCNLCGRSTVLLDGYGNCSECIDYFTSLNRK